MRRKLERQAGSRRAKPGHYGIYRVSSSHYTLPQTRRQKRGTEVQGAKTLRLSSTEGRPWGCTRPTGWCSRNKGFWRVHCRFLCRFLCRLLLCIVHPAGKSSPPLGRPARTSKGCTLETNGTKRDKWVWTSCAGGQERDHSFDGTLHLERRARFAIS
jgi:hypothetical protein